MEESVEDEPKTSSTLLYPELMSLDELMAVLRNRYIQNEDLSSLSKEGLVELYYRYVIPLPQRKYRLNRRGKEMTKKQIIMAKKRKSTTKDESEPPKKKPTNNLNSRLISSFNIPSAGDRLKPPPSCIDFSKKKISLSSKNKTEQNIVTQLEDTSLNSDSRESEDSQILQKKIVKITLDSSSNAKNESDMPKKIKLNSLTSNCQTDSKISLKLIKLNSSGSNDQKDNNESPTKIKLSSPTSPNKSSSFQSTLSLINKHLGGKTEKSLINSVIEDGTESETKPIAEELPKKKRKISRISWP